MSKSKSEDVWIEEKCYFGLMEFQRYRRKGNRVQSHVWLSLPVEAIQGFSDVDIRKEYIASVDGVNDFLQKYQDCSFKIVPGYKANDGTKISPHLFLQGWADLSPNEMHIYEEDKKYIIGSRTWTPPPKN